MPNHSIRPLNRVLVIDEMPVICLGLQEALHTINDQVTVEYTENIFTALSASSFDNTFFDLVIIGSFAGEETAGIWQPIADLRNRFINTKIALFAEQYDPLVIERMIESGIDAYVHKLESIQEIRQAYLKLSENESYISTIFYTVYYKYGLNTFLLKAGEDLTVTLTPLQKEILLLLCKGNDMLEISACLKKSPAEIRDQIDAFSSKISSRDSPRDSHVA